MFNKIGAVVCRFQMHRLAATPKAAKMAFKRIGGPLSVDTMKFWNEKLSISQKNIWQQNKYHTQVVPSSYKTLLCIVN